MPTSRVRGAAARTSGLGTRPDGERRGPRRRRLCLAAAALLGLAALRTPSDTAWHPTARALGVSQVRSVLPDVEALTAADAVTYLTGRLPGYQGATADAINNFSPADILETMDTAVLDEVGQRHGEAALGRLYEAIGRAALDALLDVYGPDPVALALDAGHGGHRGYYWDPGAEGTEAQHNRAVVAAIERLAADDPAYATIMIRRVFNDAIADDFRLPAEQNVMVYNQIAMRNVRGSVLAASAARWNAERPADAPQLRVHALSVHFNAGANGLLVLHQSPRVVEAAFAERSLAYARRYAEHALERVNATGLLAAPLRLWARTGLHDDEMLYRPPYISPAQAAQATPRYGFLQGSYHLRRYVDLILAAWS